MSPPVLIEDNYITGANYGINGGNLSENVWITGNTIENSGSTAILINQQNSGFTVARNMIVNAGTGIRFNGFDDDVQIVGNRLQGVTTGIFTANDMADLLIKDNRLEDVGGDALAFYTPGPTILADSNGNVVDGTIGGSLCTGSFTGGPPEVIYNGVAYQFGPDCTLLP